MSLRPTRKGLTLLPFLAVTLLLFAPFWATGKVFVPADFLQFIFPWRTDPAPGPIPVHNVELFDVMTLFYPEDVFINAQLKAGHLPIWNPHLFLGYPLCASGQAALWYPPRLILHLLFSPAVARTLSLMIHLNLAGMFFALWLRDRGYSRTASVGGALAYMLNGQMAAWLEYEHIVAIGCWLGLQLWLVDRATGLTAKRTGIRMSGRRGWAWLALVWGLSLQAGHLQLCLHYGLVVGFYAAFRALRNRRQTLGLCACLGLTFALATPTILPFVELLSRSQRMPLDPLRSTAPLATLLVGMLCPDIFGNPTRGFLLNRCPTHLVFPEFACFVGVIALACAIVSARERRVREDRGEWLFWGLLSVLSLVWASAGPVYQLLTLALPPLAILIPGRALLMVAPGLAILSAEGLSALEHGRGWRWLAGLAGVLLAGWLGVEHYAYQFAHLSPLSWEKTWLLWQRSGQLKLPPSDLGADYAQRCFRETYQGNFQFHLPLVLAASMLVGAVLARRRPALAAAGLVVLSTLDLGWFIVHFNTTVPQSMLQPLPPEIAFLQKQSGRVEKLGAAYNDTLTPYGLSLVTGYESVLSRRVHRALEVAGQDPKLSMRAPALSHFDHPMLAQMSLRYLLVSPLSPPPEAPWSKVFSSTCSVYENPLARPRAFWCPDARSVAGLEEALDQVAHQTSPEQVWVESGTDTVSKGQGLVELVRDTPNELVLRYQGQAGGTVVLGDSFDPGWRATVNGSAAPIWPANGCLRAVAVPPGQGEIRFVYRPSSLLLGFGLATLAFLICGLLLAI